MSPTDLPFARALSELKEERGLSFRALSDATRRVDPAGKGVSVAYLSRLSRGQYPPTPEIVRLVSDALELPSTYFAEARLAAVRDRFDERSRGLKAALKELDRYHRASPAAS